MTGRDSEGPVRGGGVAQGARPEGADGDRDAAPGRRGSRLLAPFVRGRPPVDESRFWGVQGLVLAVAALHGIVEITGILLRQPATHDHSLSFVPVALFFIPVVYAAVNYGLAGSVATAAWCTLLTVPNLIVFHQGLERVAELIQIGSVDAIAVFVGQRVDRELVARRRAEAASAALRESESRYRGLFESSPAAILVLDASGRVLEANPAAGALFDRDPEALRGSAVSDLVGPASASQLLGSTTGHPQPAGDVVIAAARGPALHLAPTLTRIAANGGSARVQVLLWDVTEERSRQVGLRAYAARVVSAQEEERKRIARELHDEVIQKLVLLCRRLDLAEAAGAARDAPTADLRAARQAAEEIVGSLRGFARALRPPSLDDLGLVASIRRLIADLTERAGIEGHLTVLGEERRLPPEVELAVFRIVQESLHNAERHSRAAHAVVTLRLDESEVSVSVADDGIGFDLVPGRDLAASGHLGLLGMRERAEALGGWLEVQSSPGHGTRVVASVGIAGRSGEAQVANGTDACYNPLASEGEPTPARRGSSVGRACD